ncbi:MAG: hypothetical protein O2783_07495 [Chloroflexi bacterium]|nr:hypothetical protein [Chloroflexota bacterium]
MFLSVKGALLLTLLLVVALGSGTALASRQAGVTAQESLTRKDGATIVTSSLCTANNGQFSVWGSGWRSGEIIILSVVKDKDTSIIWFSGSVNAAGAFELAMDIVTKPPNDTSTKVRYPGAGLFTLEALGVSGRLATTPIMTVDDKCGSDSMM